MSSSPAADPRVPVQLAQEGLRALVLANLQQCSTWTSSTVCMLRRGPIMV
jgi:hypothetical protein